MRRRKKENDVTIKGKRVKYMWEKKMKNHGCMTHK